MSTEQNKSIVRRYLDEVWGKGNLKLIRELLSPDIVDQNPVPGQPCGIEGQEWVVQEYRKALTNITLNVEDLVGQGDFVVDRWTLTATNSGPLMGMPPANKKFTITGQDMSRVVGGKIKEIWHVEDNLSMMQQLGFAQLPSQLPQSFGNPGSGTTNRETTRSGKTLSDEEKRDLVRRGFVEMLDKGNLQTVTDFIAPDYKGHFSATPPVYGIDGFKQFLSIYTTGLSNRRTEIEDILVEGDKVVCRATYFSKHTGSLLGIPPTGRSITEHSLHIFRLVGDKVVEQFTNNEDLVLMQQIGVVPVPAGVKVPEPC